MEKCALQFSTNSSKKWSDTCLKNFEIRRSKLGPLTSNVFQAIPMFHRAEIFLKWLKSRPWLFNPIDAHYRHPSYLKWSQRFRPKLHEIRESKNFHWKNGFPAIALDKHVKYWWCWLRFFVWLNLFSVWLILWEIFIASGGGAEQDV